MKNESEINYDLINDLYLSWLNEQDPFMQRKKKDDIKNRVSPYEFLMYSSRYTSPFTAFREIFSLTDLFDTLDKAEKCGKDITHFINQTLVIKDIEDIQELNRFTKKDVSSDIGNLNLRFQQSNIFQYGDIKNISKKFPYSCVNYFDLELVEEMLKNNPRDYKGIPIIITIDNIGELPLDKLSQIEESFDVAGIRIIEKARESRTHQGEQRPLNLRTYKQIRTLVNNEIISNLYINEDANKVSIDLQLATQIIDKIVSMVDYDFEAAKPEKLSFSDEVVNASGLIGLLTGKSICKGYAEIFRNVFSCVGGESKVIDGYYAGGLHSWNQIKLGDIWFNTDITTARNTIREGNPSGNLFMSDQAFFGDRRKVTLEKGVELKGKSMESTVIIGGHSNPYGLNNKKCDTYITPAVTSNLIQNSRLYDENYRKECNSKDYKGVVPYVGSNIEKTRSNSRNIETSPNR
ncbi:MAG: hypothetical protein HFJ49_01430 [Clostridia bacterium]|nr:hypothetical protein [Clostridia bacterium]